MKCIPSAMAVALSCTVRGSLVVASSFSFTPVVDTSTMVPDQATTFTSFANGPPVLDAGDIAFIGEFSGGHGWYKNVEGSLTKVADTSTVVPGDPLSHDYDILSAGDISISGGEVAFASGRISGGLFRGVYTDVGGTLHAVADANTTMPGTAQKFQLLLYPSIDNGNIAFAGRSSGTQRGIYTDLGGTLRAVDSNSSSQNHGRTSMDSGSIAYNFPQNSGIKAEIGGVVSTISPTGFDPAISGTNIAFISDSFDAIYADFGAGIVTVADTSTIVPDGSGTFQDFDSVSICCRTLTSLGRNATGQSGIYTNLSGTLERIIAEGETLDGQTVIQLFASREALSGQNVAFAANFEGGSQAIYLATYQPPLEGDYNNDHVVDAADYVVWRKSSGTQADYDAWRAHFGETSGSGAGSVANAAVPEPAAGIMLLIGMATMLINGRMIVSKLIDAWGHQQSTHKEYKTMHRITIIALATLSLLAVVASPAFAEWDDGYWYLDFSSASAPAGPLLIGVDEGAGGGFGFVTYLDHDGDGTIQGPRVPVGGRLALGVVQADGEEDCDIYVLVGSGVVGQQIVLPLLSNAPVSESVGTNFGELMAPPRAFASGERFIVANGELPDWPSLHFVDDLGVPDLESFVRDVDSLPDFNGEVVVSDARLSFTFVPEPSSLTLLILAAAGLCVRRDRSK